MKTAPLLAFVLALGFAGGFFMGSRKPAPSLVRISAGNQVARDLSPVGERGTVTAPAITQAQQKAPVPVPPELGTQLQTTTATLPALDAGARFHVATFGHLEGDRLELRPVAWLDGPQGARIPFEVTTTEAPVSMPFQTFPASRWSASVILMATPERIDPGAMIQRDWGRWRVTAGATRGGIFAGVGLSW